MNLRVRMVTGASAMIAVDDDLTAMEVKVSQDEVAN